MELLPHLRIQKLLEGTQYSVDEVKLIGRGSEGYVFESEEYVFKLIPLSSRNSFSSLDFIRKTIMNNNNILNIRRVIDVIENSQNVIFVFPNEIL